MKTKKRPTSLKMDPTRTISLRRAHAVKVKRQFALLRGRIIKFIGQMDLLSLAKKQSPISNCRPGQMRGADGRCGPGISLGIDRAEMPQIPQQHLDQFVSYARQRGFGVAEDIVDAGQLSPTQVEFRQERIDSLPQEALKQRVLVSQDDYILDGTHRWVRLWQEEKQVPVLRIGADIQSCLSLMRSFDRVKFAANELYQPFVCNGEVGWFPAPVLLDWVADVRQRDHYSCGAACSLAVGTGLGVGPKTLAEWKKLLGTSEEESTHPQSIVSTFQQLGCKAEAKDDLTLDDLTSFLQEGMPVIVCVQDYGPRVPAKARFDYGHYLVVIGRGMGYVFCQDPSEDNAVAGSDSANLDKTGSIQKPGRIMIAEDDFLKVWHDKDADGNKYVRWGCAINLSPKEIKANAGPPDEARDAHGRWTKELDEAKQYHDWAKKYGSADHKEEARIRLEAARKQVEASTSSGQKVEAAPIKKPQEASKKEPKAPKKKPQPKEDIGKGLVAVDRLEPHEDFEDMVVSPFKHNTEFALGADEKKIKTAAKTERVVSLDSLEAHQTEVFPHVVKEKMTDPSKRTIPTVVRFKGKLVIEDGNHTLTTLKLLGHKEVKVKYLDYDSLVRNDWDEQKHPRDHGRFSSSPGGSGAEAERPIDGAGSKIKQAASAVGKTAVSVGKRALSAIEKKCTNCLTLIHSGIMSGSPHTVATGIAQVITTVYSPEVKSLWNLALFSFIGGKDATKYAGPAKAFSGLMAKAFVATKAALLSRVHNQVFLVSNEEAQETAQRLMEALSDYGEDQWFIALFCAAYRHSHDPSASIEVALQLLEQRPEEEQVSNEWSEDQHERDDHGRFTGGGLVEEGLHSIATEAAEKAKSKFREALHNLGLVHEDDAVLAKLQQAGKFTKDLTAKLYGKLESRYGRKQAVAIMASAQVIGWGALGVGAVAGVPVYLPGVSLWGSLPAAALAEGYLQLRRGIAAVKGKPIVPTGNAETVDIQLEARKLVKQLSEEYQQWMKDNLSSLQKPVSNAGPHQFSSDIEKLRAFQRWLEQQVKEVILSQSQEQLWDAYIQSGFNRGAGRAFDDYSAKHADVLSEPMDFYRGTKEQFLKSAFGQPVAVEKVQLLAGRTFDELENVTDEMANKISRILADAMTEGASPNDVADEMAEQVGISQERALLISRTELIRAHAEGQLTALEQLGVEEVGVAVEWSNTGDDRVCPLCESLDGIVLKIEEARGLLPRHPGCRCAWIPAGMGEDDSEQKRSKEEIDEALEEGGLDPEEVDVDEERPVPLVNLLDEFSVAANSYAGDGHWVTLESGQHVYLTGDGDLHFSGPPKESEHERGSGAPAGGARTEAAGGQVEEAAGRPSAAGSDQQGDGIGKPSDQGAARTVPIEDRRQPVSVEEANRRLDRYANLFRAKGQGEVAAWMDKLKSHVNEVGTDKALAELGEEIKGSGEKVQYAGHNVEENADKGFIEAYLDRHGISLTHGSVPEGERRAISTVSPSSDESGTKSRGDARDVFPKLQTLKDKLEESQKLPGLEKSEDLGKLMGQEQGSKVHSFSPEVVAKLNATYGEGKWVVKSYGDEAYAGYGVFFPQRTEQLQREAKDAVWNAGGEIGKHGFSFRRDEGGKIIGIEHKNGDRYDFGTKRYEETIGGHVRHWADSVGKPRQVWDPSNGKMIEVGSPAESEHGAAIPEGRFMAQPAFAVVGVSNEERAQGVTFKQGQEGRVHITTKNGKAEIVPYSTWLKKESLPVVFESEDTKAMAKAALDAINSLPKSERMGQLYAPDIVKTTDGFRVVEANPANEAGASGYLQDNPLIIDSYVSHLTNREPAHVKFIRKLLSRAVRNLLMMNKFCRTGKGGGVDPHCKEDDDGSPEDKAKFVGEKVGKAEKDHADHVEKSVAAALKMQWEEDNKFYDAKTKDGSHFIEVKSLLKGSKTSISVHDDALLRKVDGMTENPGATYHTIAVDERATYGGGQYADRFSGHRLYYKRGSGRYSLSQMRQCKDERELKRLIATPDDQLPEKAKGSLPSGKKEITALRASAERAHSARLAKDRARKARLKVEGKSAYERQT